MKVVIGLAVAVLAVGGARIARQAAYAHAPGGGVDVSEPYAPSQQAAPYIALGYREAAADLLYVRMLGHFNSDESTGPAVADLAEAIATLDPHFHRVYETGGNAMTMAKLGVGQRIFERAISLLERGMKLYPDDWRLPYLAGQMYTQDLKTEDPAQRRAWDERGTLLVESAIRHPGAPQSAAAWAAVMRTKLGQHERAVTGLHEMLLLTNDRKSRDRLLAKLADLEKRDKQELEAEIFGERVAFEKKWRAERRTVPATMYILLGRRLTPGFNMVDLATGGRDLLGGEQQDEPLEPLE